MTKASVKKVVVTAALPYANGELHLGHLRSTYLPADIYTRFRNLIGDKAIYLCATDEHGTPILFKAEEEGIKPEEYVKIWRKDHLADFKSVGIHFHKFYQTHSPEHTELTQTLFNKLKQHTCMKPVKLHWCLKCDMSLPDRFVIGTCPFCNAEEQYGDHCEACGKVIPFGELMNAKCKKCGTASTIKEAEHLFFKLSTFSSRLESFIHNQLKAEKEVKNFVMAWIHEGLQDWDIERHISWGVPIPEHKGVFYVWFDAPIGYMTTLQKWCSENNEKFEEWWNPQSDIVHFIGKDIVYHHFLFWPAMLMAAGFNTPTEIPVRGHLRLEGKKLSKSRGWYIPLKAWKGKKQDWEYLRFYMTWTTPLGMKDTDFSASDYVQIVNGELVNNLGNLLQRILKFSENTTASKIPESEVGEVFNKVVSLKKKYEKVMLAGDMQKGLYLTSEAGKLVNVYFQAKEPWKNPEIAPEVIRTAASCMKIITQMLVPFLPSRVEKISELLNIKVKWEDDEPLPVGHILRKAKILFPRITDDDLALIKSIYEAS
ncbi:MAG: methionine--tRNA ligase [Candidatus Altiarchaeota archaeon]|nr:methionine--tRNA ligase [Candidatus Altiarchaeota archaeon]